ncbi:GxxExxY protein [Flavobacterium zepuense]|uniref:GxxExxY protein n=1 Tax=Flavobacterium zepuense TaxID=2593302 RepID=A0A552V7W4_9FLAO|nr:GxxExxY protein [Flavobacterium zepuense]TRW26556.1 GxxExxY protein [Flavobacterium zepuense]
MSSILFKEEAFEIIGLCMEVHSHLGKGHNEIVYKDALQYEFFKNNIPFVREQKFEIIYKDVILPHHYFADFIVHDYIILEVKAIETLHKSHIKQTLNYLAASRLNLGLLVNFGEDSLIHKRVIL